MRKTKRPVSAFARKSCVTATQVALAMMAAPMAYAQQAEVQKGERIEITGTRIPSPNLESSSPVAVISAQDIKFEGVTRIEDMLNSLPQVFADFGANLSNGAIGTATVNLRNLGATRTLVLMNGKRLPIGSPGTSGTASSYAPDLNQIPAPLVQRIEVLTGGASAVYGSDAIAGVVNFIMRDNFEGVQGDVNYSWYQHNQHNGQAQEVAARQVGNPTQFVVPGDLSSGGESSEVSLLMGGNFAGGKGNATVFLDYKKDKPLAQDKYDFSACSTGAVAPARVAGRFSCGGSSTTAPGGRFFDLNTGNSFTINSATGGVRPYSSNLDQFNFAPYNFYQVDQERYGFSAFAHYDVNSHARVYSEFNYHNNHTLAQIAPSGYFFGTETLLFNDNPLLSTAFKNAFGITATTPGDLFIGRRNIEGGPRQDDISHVSGRFVLGVKGDLMKNWDYDLYMQQAKVNYSEIYLNDISTTRILRSLDVVAGPGGAPTCRAALPDASGNILDANCIPWNIFTLGQVTPAALHYISVPGLKNGYTEQKVQGGTLSTDLGNYGWRFPGSKQGIGLAVGIERRVDHLLLNTDLEYSTGDLSGQGNAQNSVDGKLEVKDYFAEIRVPIRDWASVNGSYRYSDYSTGKTTDSYGLGFELSPWKPLKLRGSYQQAVRAPNIIELFQPQQPGLVSIAADPCGPSRSATPTQCARSGLPAGQYGADILISPAGQYNGIFGGNPSLDAEKGKTYTVGLVFQPLRNLSGSIDYFDIKVDNLVGTVSSQTALTQCLQSGQFCELIHREARTGALWVTGGFITATNINTGSLKTTGIDVALNYNYNIGKYGGLAFSFNGTMLDKYVVEQITGFPTYDCAGLFGPTCGIPLPKWRHKFRTVWSAPWNFDLVATWRHIDKVRADLTDANPILAGSFEQIGSTLGARDYLDLSFSYNFWKNWSFRFGVNNVFDRDPPICDFTNVCNTAVLANGNTYPQVYDALGRKFFTGLTVSF